MRDVSTTGGYVPFSIYKYMKKKHVSSFPVILRKRHYVQVSRLVALAYIPNSLNKPFVCHKDNNPKNNFYKNLYWGTQSENIQQCVKDGRHQSCKLDM